MFAAALRKLSFTKKLEASYAEDIFLVRGRDPSGQRAWYYVLIERAKREAFKAREGTPFLKLTDFGDVLYSGFGNDAPAEIKKIMEEEYGFIE